MIPEPIKKFVDVFSKLPSIGPRQATRLAFYISSLGKNKVSEIAEAVLILNELTTCGQCFRTFNSGRLAKKLCSICADQTRSKDIIAIIEKETDLLSLERTKNYNGWYLLLGELHKNGDLEPEQKLRLDNLKSYIKKELGGQAKEIILAINPTIYGDLNSSTIKKELDGFAEKITRLGRGIPTGGEIEFADAETLSHSLQRRH